MTKWNEKNGIEFWTMPYERAEEALGVLRNGFFSDEACCNALGVTEDEEGQKELELLCLEAAKDGVSIMAIDKETKKIIGVCYNKIQVKQPPGEKGFFQIFMETKCHSKSAAALINEMIEYDSFVDLFATYDADCALELMFLGTHRDFRRRGVAVGCVDAALALARSLPLPSCPYKPQIATALFTSPYSIRTGRIHHFDELYTLSVKDRVYEGKRFADHPKIGENHPGIIVMAKRL